MSADQLLTVNLGGIVPNSSRSKEKRHHSHSVHVTSYCLRVIHAIVNPSSPLQMLVKITIPQCKQTCRNNTNYEPIKVVLYSSCREYN